MARFTRSRVPRPAVNRQYSAPMSTQPLAMKVLTTPMPVFSQNSFNCLLARRRMQPLPARMTGFLALRSSSNAWLTILSSVTGRRRRRGVMGFASVSSLAMSSGSSMCTAPGFSVVAMLTDLRMISGMASGVRTVSAHLVTGSNMATTSMTWWDSLCSRWVFPWPVSTSSGERSMLESATPVIRLVAPGPRVPRQAAGMPVSRP